MLASGSSKASTLFHDKKVATRPSLILESKHALTASQCKSGIWGFGFTDPGEFLVTLCITCIHQILKCKAIVFDPVEQPLRDHETASLKARKPGMRPNVHCLEVRGIPRQLQSARSHGNDT